MNRKRVTPEMFTIDGSEHYADVEKCASWCSAKKCACGEWIHREAVYGPSIANWCPNCENEGTTDEP